MTNQFKPYCACCGQVRPEELTNVWTCTPCAKRGHGYRLVSDETDRQYRIRLWQEYYDKNSFTATEVKRIPFFQRLLNVPVVAFA